MLGANLGRDVSIVLSRAHRDPSTRLAYLIDQLSSDGVLTGALRVPDTAGDIEIVADLRARQLQVIVEVTAPKDKGHRGRIGWLTQQLGVAPPQTVIEAWPKNARSCHSATVADVRVNRDILSPDGKESNKFRISLLAEMGLNRSNGGKRAGFVESSLGLINAFYEQVVQSITPWQPAAPKTNSLQAEPADGAGDAMRNAPTPVLVDD
ncbi:hypothetical protein BH23ACT10_BH23ACT10_24340 [soil metagenome]